MHSHINLRRLTTNFKSSSLIYFEILHKILDYLYNLNYTFGKFGKEEFMDIVAKRLKELIKVNKLNQKQVAELVGVTEATMSRYLNGNRIPRPEVLSNLATVLNTTSDYILGKVENPSYINTEFGQLFALVSRNAKNLSPELKQKLIKEILNDQ